MDSKKRAQPETAGGVPKKRRTELNGDSHASGSVEREDEPTGHADLEVRVAMLSARPLYLLCFCSASEKKQFTDA